MYVRSIWPTPAPIRNLVRKINGPSLLKLEIFRVLLTPFDSIAKKATEIIKKEIIGFIL